MAESEIQICNLSLFRVGISSTINSLDEPNTPARACKAVYAHSRDRLLQAFPWNFATRIANLADIGQGDVRWGYRYQYPNDCLHVLQISNGPIRRAGRNQKTKFRVVEGTQNETKAILTDQQFAAIEYTALITNPTLFDPLFTELLSWTIAKDIARPLRAEQKLAADAFNNYLFAFNEAGSRHLAEAEEDEEPDSEFVTARY